MSAETPDRPSSGSSIPVFAIVLLLAAIGAFAYSWHEHNVARELAAQNSAISGALDSTRGQLDALTAKVNALEAKPVAEEQTRPHAAVYRKPLRAASSRHRIDDPRWKKMQGQLDDQGRQIEATRQDLATARTELGGTMAKTHDELVALERKGERNYYEFDLDKAGQFQRQGSVGIRLRKANTKHEYADLELLVDDLKLSKKHVNVYEPVVFYPANDKLPVELVINSVTRNHIHGYVSEPKYRGADLQASANSAGAQDAAQTSAGSSPTLRQRSDGAVSTPSK